MYKECARHALRAMHVVRAQTCGRGFCACPFLYKSRWRGHARFLDLPTFVWSRSQVSRSDTGFSPCLSEGLDPAKEHKEKLRTVPIHPKGPASATLSAIQLQTTTKNCKTMKLRSRTAHRPFEWDLRRCLSRWCDASVATILTDSTDKLVRNRPI